MNLTLLDLAELTASAAFLIGVGVAAAMMLSPKETSVPHPQDPDPPKSAAECSMAMVRGAIRREFRLLIGPRQRLELLRLIRSELAELHAVAGQELHTIQHKEQR